MSQEEIFFRLSERRLEKKEHAHHLSGKDQVSDEHFLREWCGLSSQDHGGQILFDDFWSGQRDHFFTEIYVKEHRAAHIKEHLDIKNWLVNADRLCEGRVCLLGKNVLLAQLGGWHKDPLEGCEWPRVFYTHVHKAQPSETVDIKYVWEMNRHQYLIVLGKAYWITGDEKYAKKVGEIISSWISDNPYHSGVNWTSSLELAVRSISWIWAYLLCQGSQSLDAAFHRIFVKSIGEHALHIEHHLSYFSSPYNHLIGEAAGLHMIGSLFSQLKRGRTWEQLGWSILEKHIDQQFFDDGMCVEQATFYHHFTLGFYLQAALLRKINSKPVSEKILSVIEKALDASMHLTQPNGRLPAIGDIDNARSLYFSEDHSWDFRGFLSVGAVLFHRADFKHKSNGFCEELFWLCDDSYLAEFETMKSALPRETSKALSSSGYFVMRTNWEKDSHYLCFDSGVIAAGLHEGDVPSAAHGHADALSFSLSVFGKPILVEGGFHTYFGPVVWHRHFREEAAHNTIKMGGHTQAEYCDRLTWKSVINPKLQYWRQEDKLQAVCGEIVYDKETRHRREILSIATKFWVLSDWLQSPGRHEKATAYFHLDSAVALEIDRENKQVIAGNGDGGLVIQYFEDYEVEARRGEEGMGPEAGWQAEGYGYKKPTWVLSFSIPLSKKTVVFPLLLLPWKGEKSSFSFKESSSIRSNTDDLYCKAFSFDQENYMISFREDDSPFVQCNGVTM